MAKGIRHGEADQHPPAHREPARAEEGCVGEARILQGAAEVRRVGGRGSGGRGAEGRAASPFIIAAVSRCARLDHIRGVERQRERELTRGALRTQEQVR